MKRMNLAAAASLAWPLSYSRRCDFGAITAGSRAPQASFA